MTYEVVALHGIPILFKHHFFQSHGLQAFILSQIPAYSGRNRQSLAQEEKVYIPQELQGIKSVFERNLACMEMDS